MIKLSNFAVRVLHRQCMRQVYDQPPTWSGISGQNHLKMVSIRMKQLLFIRNNANRPSILIDTDFERFVEIKI